MRRFRMKKFFETGFIVETVIIVMLLVGIGILVSIVTDTNRNLNTTSRASEQLAMDKLSLEEQLASAAGAYQQLQEEDQYVINQDLNNELNSIKRTYGEAVDVYENLLKLKEASDDIEDVEELDEQYTEIVVLLVEEEWEEAGIKTKELEAAINEELDKIASTVSIPASVPTSNTPPSNGYSRQQVETDAGNFMVSMVAGDLASTRVIVDTASEGDCTNDCPVLPLATYVSRNGAYAGINGSYFCPASYPSCAGKTNSFDTLAMNKNKHYFNSDNNVYSTVPVAIFGDGWVRFEGQSQNWGRDTGVDGVLANQPLLVSGGNIAFGGDADPKKGSKAGRSFVANKGNTVYIGVVHNATVVEAAHALKNLGMDNGLNLDSGGSTAFWSGGYKAGPGRNIPNAILFVQK